MAVSHNVGTQREQLFVGGEWTAQIDGLVIDVINPATEEVIGAAAVAGPGDIDRAVRAARAAFDHGPWPRSSPVERAAVLRRAAELIAERADEFSRLITLEVGSPHRVASSQPFGATALLNWYAAQAESYPWEERREGSAGDVLSGESRSASSRPSSRGTFHCRLRSRRLRQRYSQVARSSSSLPRRRRSRVI